MVAPDGSPDGPDEVSVYDSVGGLPWFVALVDRFYDAVAIDPVLTPLYPQDLRESRRTTSLFLAQFWGGPPHYSKVRGHPRLRMRHFPFAIGLAERDAWLGHMLAAVRSSPVPLPSEVEALFVEYFERASSAMINQDR
ncbi:MAG: globin [Actinomycetota bacterium]|nr:globin [Actinomycetota bacterium]